MKRILLILALVAAPALAEESKPIGTQIGDAVRPAAKAYGDGVQGFLNDFFANSNGPMGQAARINKQAQEQREREANRGTRRTMQECIKPGNVIDDDVKECMEGIRVKTWQ